LLEGAVVIRSVDRELQLQGLRTAVSLALGDRPARVYLVRAGTAVLAAAKDSEAGQCLEALREARVAIIAEAEESHLSGQPQRATLAEILAQSGAAGFQQTF
jgi:hypothetical protein